MFHVVLLLIRLPSGCVYAPVQFENLSNSEVLEIKQNNDTLLQIAFFNFSKI